MKLRWFNLFFLILTMMLHAQPEWYKKPPTDKYPSSVYLMGIGSSDKDYDKAVDAAMSDLSKQIKAFVKTRSVSKKTSSSVGDTEMINDSYREASLIYSNIELRGTEIAAREKDGDHFYALVILEKARYATILESDIRDLNGEIGKLWSLANSYVDSGNIAQAVPAFMQVHKKLFFLKNKWDIYTTVATPDSILKSTVTETDVADRIRSLINNISLQAVGDTDIRLKSDGKLIPLMVKLTDMKGNPLSRVPIAFTLHKKKTKPVIRYTNDKGIAEYKKYSGYPWAKNSSIEAYPALPIPSKMGKSMLSGLTVVFNITRERMAEKSIGFILEGTQGRMRNKAMVENVFLAELKKHHINAHPGDAETTLKVNIGAEKLNDMTSMRRLVRVRLNAEYALYKGNHKIDGFIRESSGIGSSMKQAMRKAMKGLLPTEDQYRMIRSTAMELNIPLPEKRNMRRISFGNIQLDSRSLSVDSNVLRSIENTIREEIGNEQLTPDEFKQTTKKKRNLRKPLRPDIEKNRRNKIDKFKNDGYIVFGKLSKSDASKWELNLQIKTSESGKVINETTATANDSNQLIHRIPKMIEQLKSF